MSPTDATPDYADDSSIEDDEEIWRRIPADMVVRDRFTGKRRPKTGMFSDSYDGSPMSAHRARCYGSPIEANTGDYLMVGLAVGYLRSLGLGVATNPPTEDFGHVWVFGKKTPSIKRKLATNAKWVIPPDSVA